jgi:hypothetical protein
LAPCNLNDISYDRRQSIKTSQAQIFFWHLLKTFLFHRLTNVFVKVNLGRRPGQKRVIDLKWHQVRLRGEQKIKKIPKKTNWLNNLTRLGRTIDLNDFWDFFLAWMIRIARRQVELGYSPFVIIVLFNDNI